MLLKGLSNACYNKCMEQEAKELIKYIKSCGLEVHTGTKARGHQGFYLKNRIDISKNISPQRVIPTLLHEFAHYVHSLLEPLMARTGGTLEVLFDTSNTEIYEKELLLVTHFVDSHSKCEKLELHKKLIKNKILEYEKIIKLHYPKFMRSKKFKEFDKYIKKSNARYLLKYDRVKLVTGVLFKKVRMFSIDNIEKDFCDMPVEFAAYIRLKSCQKRQSRVSARINRLKKYYSKPTELFARFVEGLYIDPEQVFISAPQTCKRFFELLDNGYYPYLSKVIKMYYKPSNL